MRFSVAVGLFTTLLFTVSALGNPAGRRYRFPGPGELSKRDLYNSHGDWNRTYLPAEPQQIHISLGTDAKFATVGFVTSEAVRKPIVQYWPRGRDSRRPHGSRQHDHETEHFWKLIVSDGESFPFVDGGTAKHTIYIHNVRLANLRPYTIYQYRVGTIDQSGKETWADQAFEFHTLTKGDVVNFIATADLGLDNAVAYPHMVALAKSHKYDFLTLSGDQAYDMADFNGTKGDQYMNFAQDLFANVPFMGGVGNHEQAYNFSHWKNRFSNVPYKESNFANPMQYSYSYKSLHIISFSTEIYFEGSPNEITTALNWLENDLQEANKERHKRPWIIVMSHHPAYCTSYSDASDTSCLDDTATVRDGPLINGVRVGGIEDILLKYKVDVYLTGHRHNYERTYPIAKGVTTSFSYDKAPSYFEVLVGNSGNFEETVPFNSSVKPDWSAVRYDGYGFSTVKATPHMLEFTHWGANVDGSQGKIIDHFVATK